jgi:pyridoxamine 5'-phosphate oxidase-like protein
VTSPDDLEQMAREVIDSNQYLTLGTTEDDGRPRLSPVYFTHVDYRDFSWVSSPEARHSTNLTERPAVSLVIFDSTAPVGDGRAVYVDAQATVILDEDLPDRCAAAFAHVRPGARAFHPHELSGDAPLRLYLAEAAGHEVHIPARHPVYGSGVDHRRPVHL